MGNRNRRGKVDVYVYVSGYGYGYDMGKLVLYVRLVTSRAYDGDMWRT